jgi:hypothetical protein
VRNEEVLLKSQVAEKYPAWNKQTVDWLDWSHFA